MIKVIVFDFDGVLVDSNRLKRDTFFTVFSNLYPRAEAVMKEVYSEIGHKSRFDIFRRALEKLETPADSLDELVRKLADDYNAVVQDGIKKLGLVPEAVEVLKRLSAGRNLYINSATPENALNESVDNIGIKRFFRGVYGIPFTKEENLQKIMEQEKVLPGEVIFVGDGEVDRNAADNCGVNFIGVANEFNKWENEKFSVINNLLELKKFL